MAENLASMIQEWILLYKDSAENKFAKSLLHNHFKQKMGQIVSVLFEFRGQK